MHLRRNPTDVTPNYQTIREHSNPVHNVKPLANHDKLVLLEISGFDAMQLVTTNLHRTTSQKSEINLNITLPPTSVTVLNTTFHNRNHLLHVFYLYYQSHPRYLITLVTFSKETCP
jgi:hypothetical protein